ncbi:MAG: hypothetical protein Q8M16_01365 [Pirellulaceae bacterium]|nr:hypothetical protein [Pirellulaceae bacterium]
MRNSSTKLRPATLVTGIVASTLCLPWYAVAQENSTGAKPNPPQFQISDDPILPRPVQAIPPKPSPIIDIAPSEPLVPAPLEEPKSNPESIREVIEQAIEEAVEVESRLDIFFEQSKAYTAYRSYQTGFQWIAGSNDDFGWFSWQSDPYLRRESDSGLSLTFNLHGLSGPIAPNVSPRLYDAVASYQVRKSFSSNFSYDVAASVGVFSDFEGSARKGVRFPAHAVGMIHLNYRADLVFGADYLDRQDIKILPVAGVSIREFLAPNVRLDLIFPRPRIDFALDNQHRVYVAGLLGGGTWDYEATADTRELLTYRDYRVVLGFEFADNDNHLSSIEFGYAFGRQLEFANAGITLNSPDAFVLQWVSRY